MLNSVQSVEAQTVISFSHVTNVRLHLLALDDSCDCRAGPSLCACDFSLALAHDVPLLDALDLRRRHPRTWLFGNRWYGTVACPWLTLQIRLLRRPSACAIQLNCLWNIP